MRRKLVGMSRRQHKRLRALGEGIPVSPAITAGIQAPLGVADIMFPLSITLTQVVS